MALNLVGTSGNATIDADTGISGFTIDFDVWTTATRPASPSTGDTGFNSDLNCLETYNGSAWVSQLPSQTGNNGKYLTTNGTSPSWAAVAGGPEWQSVQTGNFNATAGNAYPINTTSAAITVTLPASPTAGQQIILTDYAGTWATNNVTVNPNGNKITGQTGDGTLSTNNATCSLVYVDSTRGWISYSNVIPIFGYSVEYLMVAGGGGASGGGGGAGGLLNSTFVATQAVSYTITVGAGGAGGRVNISESANGQNSTISGSGLVTITAIGGGHGGAREAVQAPASGGSGGGGGNDSNIAGADGTTGQGNDGGSSPSGPYGTGAGGGGAGAAAPDYGQTNGAGKGDGSGGGYGGIGLQFSTWASATSTGDGGYYAGGGAGGCATSSGSVQTPAALGGDGGGGDGARLDQGVGTSGTANTGGGGGGNDYEASSAAGSGGSGIVIIRYAGSQRGTGGTVTSSGGYTYHTFTTSGTYTA